MGRSAIAANAGGEVAGGARREHLQLPVKRVGRRLHVACIEVGVRTVRDPELPSGRISRLRPPSFFERPFTDFGAARSKKL